MPGPSYRRFAPVEVREPSMAGAAAVLVGLRGAQIELDADDHALAQLFDGDRDAAQIRALASSRLGRQISPAALEAFAARLGVAGVLEPGFWEPLPSPALTEEGEAQLVRADSDSSPMLPSTMPGSLAGPGLMGGLLSLVTDRRGTVREPWARLSPGPWVRAGALLNWPLLGRGAMLLLAALLVFVLYGLWQQRVEAAADLLTLRSPYAFAGMLWLGLTLIHLFGQAARAHAVDRFAGSRPEVGLLRGPFVFPLVHVETRGPAERADRAARARIVGSALTALTLLFIGCLLFWFLSRDAASPVAGVSLWIAALVMLTLLLRLNPLARRDGYFLLAQWLGIPDLREQAFAAVAGFGRLGWVMQQRRLGRGVLVLYALLSLASLLALLVLAAAMPGEWITSRFGGFGFILVVALMGVLVSQSYRNSRAGSANTDLGSPGHPWWKFWADFSRTTWIVIIAIGLVSILPYRYHASGDFDVLPSARADVRALTPGDVREVLVKEGDLVKAGQVIARISDYEQRALVAAAEAKLAALESEKSLAQKGGKAEEVAVAESAVQTAQKRAEVSASQARRIANAYRNKSVTAQEYERAQGIADVDAKALEEARGKLALVQSPAVAERMASIEAGIREAQAELVYQRQRLAYTRITAPIAGRVVSGSLMFSRGSFLNRGDQLAVIEDAGERVAEIKLPENAIGEIKIGNEVNAKAWAFPGTSFEGKVLGIAPAAEDSPYGKVVRVRVSLSDPDNRLLPGMTGNAKVAGGWNIVLVQFTRALARFLFVEVWSWIP